MDSVGKSLRRWARSSVRNAVVASSPRTRNPEWLAMLARWVSRETLRLQRIWRRVKSRRPVVSARAAVSVRAADAPEPLFSIGVSGSAPRKWWMRMVASAIQGTSTAWVFHQRASAPPGRSTRRASGTERMGSVQCQDWAYVRKSVEAVATGRASPAPADEGDVGVGAAELGGHAGAGFHGEDVGAAGVEEPGGDAGAGAYVDGA